MPATAGPVTSPGLLLCEGPDDFAFFLSLLAFLQISDEIVRIERLEGRRQLHDRLNGLAIRDQGRILKAMAIVCDADDPDDGQAAFGKVRDDLRATGFSVPERAAGFVHVSWGGSLSLSVGVFIMPDNRATGALEDLCLTAIAGEPSLACVEPFLNCVSAAGG